MKRLSNNTRVLVADGGRGVVLRNDGDAEFPNLKVVKSYGQDNPATHEQGTDKPGRTNESIGNRRSSMEPTDWHQIAEDRFVQKIAADMAKDLSAGEFDALVVAAPPVALGEFRKAVSDAVSKSIVLEMDKDLTKHPLHEIEKMVVKALDEASFNR